MAPVQAPSLASKMAKATAVVATGVAAVAVAAGAVAVAGAVAGAELLRDNVPWESILQPQLPAQYTVGTDHGRVPPEVLDAVLRPEERVPMGTMQALAAAERLTVPPSLSLLSSLKHLTLRNVSSLPEDASQLPPNLTALHVWGPQGEHHLSYVPNSILRLSLLADLELRGSFPCVPAGLGSLTHLRRLKLVSPKIDTLPLSTSRLTGLEELLVEGCTCGPFKFSDSLLRPLSRLRVLSIPSMPGAMLPADLPLLTALEHLSIEQPLSYRGPSLGSTPLVYPVPVSPLSSFTSDSTVPVASLPPSSSSSSSSDSTHSPAPERGLGGFGSLLRSPWGLGGARDRFQSSIQSFFSPGKGKESGPSPQPVSALHMSHSGVTAVDLGVQPLFSAAPSRFSVSECCLPPTIGNLRSLTHFRLRCPHIASLPDSFVRLPKLKELELQFSGTLPRSFGQLKTLSRLVLDSPGIYTLPDSLGELSSLTSLTLSCEGLVLLPNSIGGLSRLSSLSLLRCHSLSALPPSFGALEGLRTLELRCHNLPRLPRSFCFLSGLEELSLESHLMTELPDNFGLLSSLRRLELKCKALQCLPPSFSELPPDVRMQASLDLLVQAEGAET